MAIKSTQAVEVQLQQKIDGVLKPVNPATLAELVKLQNGINLETKVGEIESSVEAVEGRADALEGQMIQAQSVIAGLQAKDGELEQSIASHVGTLTQTIEAVDAKAIANAQGIATLTSGLQATDAKVAANEGAIAKAEQDIASITEALKGCIYYTVVA